VYLKVARLWEYQHGQIGSRSVMLHIINKHVHEASNQKTQHNSELLCPQTVLHTFSGNGGLICLCTMYSLQRIMMLSQWEWRNCTIAQASTLNQPITLEYWLVSKFQSSCTLQLLWNLLQARLVAVTDPGSTDVWSINWKVPVLQVQMILSNYQN
jgi:hypothetical protein